jgi:hypothetical protein
MMPKVRASGTRTWGTWVLTRLVPSLLTEREADQLNKETKMPRVSLDQPAPDFSLPNFSAKMVSLTDFRGKKNVLLVFNRGFI